MRRREISLRGRWIGWLAVLIAGFALLTGCPEPEEQEQNILEDGDGEYLVEIDTEASVLDVEESDTVEVVVDVENIGDRRGMQDIQFVIEGVADDRAEGVELAEGDATTVSFEWTTGEGDAGEYTAEVWSEDSHDTADVTVSEDEDENGDADVEFTVEIDEEESVLTAPEGDDIEVAARVDNVGEEDGIQDIHITIGDLLDGEHELELDAGSASVVTFTWETEEGHAGEYDVEVWSEDDSDTTQVVVTEPGEEPALSGTVIDAETESGLGGVVVELYDDGGFVDSATSEGDGSYAFDEVDDGDYSLRLDAPGLHPDHFLEEGGGGSVVAVTIDGDAVVQDVTVDWLRFTDLVIDGGAVEFAAEPGGDAFFELPLPGCEYDSDDDEWISTGVPATSDGPQVTFDPDGECFRFDSVSIGIADGVLNIGANAVQFPDIEVSVDDEGTDIIHPDIDDVEIGFEHLVDGAFGQVDFREGSLDVELNFRFLVGGEVTIDDDSLAFGSEADADDCQFTGAWGGDVSDPAEDEDDEELGGYVHESMSFQLTTGDSGDEGASGVPFDADTGAFVLVDNVSEIGRLSEGAHGADDPGGASCGEQADAEIDYASVINSAFALPGEPGEVTFEFDLLIP